MINTLADDVKAMREALNEMGYREIKPEFKVDPPSFQAILDLIPKEKLIIVETREQSP